MSHQTYNLDEALAEGRQTIDATWSPKTKRIVIGASVLVAAGAITGGLWAASAFSTPGMPGTAQEALAVLGTPKFERMSEDRKSAYAEEAGRLLRDLPEEDRRAMFRDEEQRQAMRALMEQRMADMARAVARGETPDFASMFGGPNRGARPPRDDERRRRFEEMTEEERDQRRAEMQERMRERMNETYRSGNAQNSELMGEMFRSGMGRMGPGGRGGGGRGGGGGGQGGGGGGTRG